MDSDDTHLPGLIPRMVSLIREAGRVPAERDALYNILQVYDGVAAPETAEVVS